MAKKPPLPPDQMHAAVVASYECPRCDKVMLREKVEIEGVGKRTAYRCHNPECELSGTYYWPPKIQLHRVGALENW